MLCIEKPSSLFFLFKKEYIIDFFFNKNAQKHQEEYRQGDTFAAQNIPGDSPEGQWVEKGREITRTNPENLHTEKYEPSHLLLTNKPPPSISGAQGLRMQKRNMLWGFFK